MVFKVGQCCLRDALTKICFVFYISKSLHSLFYAGPLWKCKVTTLDIQGQTVMCNTDVWDMELEGASQE